MSRIRIECLQELSIRQLRGRIKDLKNIGHGNERRLKQLKAELKKKLDALL